MKYVSLDIETTGLSPGDDQILEFAAVVDDWVTPIGDLPKFERLIKHDRIRGNPFALHMNSEILRLISKSPIVCDRATKRFSQGCCTPDQLLPQFNYWLNELEVEPMNIHAAGHNAAGFDIPFIKWLDGYGEIIKFHHRVLDVGSLYFEPDDHELPFTQKCLSRAGIPGELQHRALPDALNAVHLIRAKYGIFPRSDYANPISST